jgi:hypothetical protein
VQNALLQLNGAAQVRQLVLVTTKKSGKSTGIKVAGQTGIIYKKSPDLRTGNMQKTTPALFHRYSLVADKQGKVIQYGASIGYLRDAVPPLKEERYKISKPANFDRLQGTVYAHTAIGKQNDISLQSNYTPQYFGYEQQYKWQRDSNNTSIEQAHYRARNTSFNMALNWQMRFLKKWSNSLNVAMNRFRISQHDSNWYEFNNRNNNYYHGFRYRYNQIRNTLRYSSVYRNWQVEPTLSFNYFKGKQDIDWKVSELKDGLPIGHSGLQIKASQRFIELTPAVLFSLSDRANITGGVLTDLNPKVSKRLFPFVSATADLLHMGRSRSDASLKLFFSYARFNKYTEFASGFQETAYIPASASVYAPTSMWRTRPESRIAPTDSVNRMLSAGSNLALFQKRLNIQYYFENRNCGLVVQESMDAGPGSYFPIIQPRILHSVINRVSVLYNAVEKSNMKLTTGFNFTKTKIWFSEQVLYYDPHQFIGNMGDGQTGGWTTRIYHKNVQLGIDVLYILGEKIRQPTLGSDTKKMNALLLQHFYIGYTLQPASNHPISFYLNSRNPVQDRNYRLNKDGRRFYGAGFEMKL